MKALLSIKPEFVNEILTGRKKYEYRKRIFKQDIEAVVIYASSTEASQDALQGLTAAGAYADEAALFPQNFIDQMMGRCSVEGSKVWMNCNPENDKLYKKMQIQRSIERDIRKQKRECMLYDEIGDKEAFEAASVKLKQKEAHMKEYLQKNPKLVRRKDREQVIGFDRSNSAKAVAAKKAYTKAMETDTIPVKDIKIPKSVGAKFKNYKVVDKTTGVEYEFAPGTRIQNGEVFAGKGTKHPLHEGVAEGLSKEFGGTPSKWQHAKGFGILQDEETGEELSAEVHWFQEETVGKVKFKVKRWLDDEG